MARPTRPATKPSARSGSRKPAVKSAPSARKPADRKRSAPRAGAPRRSSLSPERKIDLIGAAMALGGLLSLLSFISATQSQATSTLLRGMQAIAGWGGFMIPLALLLFGLWLVFRNVDRLPALSAERITGLFLFYLTVLAWMHLLGGGGWQLARDGKGGGFLGAVIERLLVPNIGAAAAGVVLLALLILAVTMTLDISLAEMAAWIKQKSARKPARPVPQPPAAQPRAQSPNPSEPEPITDPDALPPEFQPLTQVNEPAPRLRVSPGERVKPAPAAAGREKSSLPAAQSEPPPPGTIAWSLPPAAEILDPPSAVADETIHDHERARIIEKTLASFGAPAHVVEVKRGPTVTQFGVEPDFIETRNGKTRVRVGRIASLVDDLALALAAQRIRIEAPVPGHNYVGIEVPNEEISRVALLDVLQSDSFQKLRSPLRLALGKDVSGKAVAADLTAMPHLLIAGTTGSGKSVCVNAILSSLLLTNTPVDLRLVLVDPKRVELTGYNGIPHLLAPVVVEPERVIGALQWVLREMDSRYQKFAKAGARNIKEYNNKREEHLPYLVVVIDELADLMMLAPDETERSVTRLAQLSRATGIHLVIATQRPSVDVVTGLIKANFPARIAFAVATGIDSRVVLDQPGAERLLGRGDMLFQAPDAPAPVRLQGVFVSDAEIQRLVDAWRTAAARYTREDEPSPFFDSLPRGVPLKQAPLWEEPNAQAEDPVYDEALDLVRREGRASISMLQRRMRIGYNRAARIIDRLEENGIIGPQQPGSQVREILDYGPARPPEDTQPD